MHNSEQIAPMHSYAGAVNHFNKVVPLKHGRLKGAKPLGAVRRYTRVLIRMDDDVVVCSLYNKDVVKYFPNGEIHVNLCKYNTNSTRDFIYYTTHMAATTTRGKPYLRVSDKSFLLPEDGPLVVKDGQVINAQAQTVYRVNRKAMNEVRKRYAEFIEYCDTVGSLLDSVSGQDVQRAGAIIQDDLFSESKLRQLIFADSWYGVSNGGRTTREYLTGMLEKITKAQAEKDYEQMSARLTQLAVSNMHFNWRTSNWVPRVSGEPVSLYARGTLDEVLKYVHCDEVFKTVQIPIGEVSGTTNEKYFLL
jgi:hypothetical protein